MRGAVIVAAGLSSRMGTIKALLPMDGVTVIEKIINTLRLGGIQKIAVVIGYQGALISEVLKQEDILLVQNNDYINSQMFDSAKLGLVALKEECDTILFLPVDVPMFSVETVRRLVMETGHLAVPSYQEKQGHPVKIDSSLIDEIMEYNGNQGLRGALNNLSMKMSIVSVEDEGILFDMDTYEEYQFLLQLA